MFAKVVITLIFGKYFWISGVHSFFFYFNDECDIRYFLFSRQNPQTYQELKINNTEILMKSNFNFHQPTRIIVHGWMSSGTASTVEEIKNAYLEVTYDNIITVEWSKKANTFYFLARHQVPGVSESLAHFLLFLVKHGVNTTNIHLIGHSVGAHVVGIAGKLYGKQKEPIPMITALDPAKPLFLWSDVDNRLDKSDAIHVEVIHTCGGILSIHDAIGHLDFYPNGGRSQPGCWLDITGSCSHNRAIKYFADSITTSVPFTSVKCENYDELYENGECSIDNALSLNMSGLHLNYGKKGVYYLKTKSDIPYALGNPDNWDNSSSESSITKKIKLEVEDILSILQINV